MRRTAEFALGYHDILVKALVVRHHETDPLLKIEPAHHLLIATLQDLDNGRLHTPPAILTDDPHHRPITVQQLAHLAGREKQIIPPSSGRRKPKPSW